jgi:hypothetical protein
MNDPQLVFSSSTVPTYQPGDIVTTTTTIYPKWWQFWRSPVTAPAAYICVSSGSMNHEDGSRFFLGNLGGSSTRP